MLLSSNTAVFSEILKLEMIRPMDHCRPVTQGSRSCGHNEGSSEGSASAPYWSPEPSAPASAYAACVPEIHTMNSEFETIDMELFTY